MLSKRLWRLLLALTTVGVLAASAFPGTASASHGRYSNISWLQTGTNTVDFTFTGAFRRCGYTGSAPDGCPAVGDVIFEGIGATSLSFGDSSSTGTLSFRVIAINTAEDWLLAQALDPNRPAGDNTDVLIGHTYSGPGPWTANASGCCTIFALNNNSGGFYEVDSLVNLTADQESPRSSIPPIVTVGNTGTQMWPVPAIDSGGETLRWRLATGAEACNGCFDPNPPGMTINPTTGVVSWDTTGVAMGLWFTSVVIEALGPTGAVVSTTQVTYLVQVAPITTNQPPDWVSPPTPAQGTVFTVCPGQSVSFSLQAADPNTGDTVTIGNLGLPVGASFTSTPGNPATASFSWTPTAGQTGDHLVTFTAQDNAALPLSAVARTYVIRVGACDTTPPTCVIATKTAAGITVNVRDTGSGLGSIVVTKSVNATVTWPTFIAGTTATVVVTGAKNNLALSSTIALRVTDVDGNITLCDPVIQTMIRENGSPATETYSGLPQAESKVWIENGRPGVNRLDITVNGKTWKLTGLKAGQEISLDVASAMVAGDNNTITVTAHGKPGGSALVVISD